MTGNVATEYDSCKLLGGMVRHKNVEGIWALTILKEFQSALFSLKKPKLEILSWVQVGCTQEICEAMGRESPWFLMKRLMSKGMSIYMAFTKTKYSRYIWTIICDILTLIL